MARILAIDDESAITDLLVRSLSRDGHSVDAVNDPTSVPALDLSRYDLVLCDVMMPKLDGIELVKGIRDRVDGPIVFITAKVTEEDAVRGLGAGADEYIRKPFGVTELRAKVAAYLRRESRVRTHVLAVGAARFNLDALELFVNETPVPLTATEYAVCEFLARHRAQTLSRSQIRNEALGWISDAGDDAISMHVSNARAKLRQAGIDPIETIRGRGYRWEA